MKTNKKCNDFSIMSENSDAECYLGLDFEAEAKLKEEPELCEICVYNKKFKGMNYKDWKEYRKKIGIKPKV